MKRRGSNWLPGTDALPWAERIRHTVEVVRRAFSAFLLIPTIVIIGFLAIAVLIYYFGQARLDAAGEAHGLFGTRLFSSSETSRGFLATIAGGIITVTSITFSLLLIAVQQGAASLTSVVFDQFLRRRINQLYFGFFLGLALFCLINLAATTPAHNPVYGVAFAFVMTIVALYMLILLIYTTVDQARPAVIVEAIHDHTLRAWERRRSLVARTRRTPGLAGVVTLPVFARTNGFLSDVDIGSLSKVAGQTPIELEFVILVSIGDYVSYGDHIADIATAGASDRKKLEEALLAALPLENQRYLDNDPALGVQQLAIIGWTSVSTAKSNPEPGLLACWALRDLLARQIAGNGQQQDAGKIEPVVYSDNVLDEVINALESLSVVASESMQHQTIAALYESFAKLYPRLGPDLEDRIDGVLLRSLSALGEHVLSKELDTSLTTLIEVLDGAGRPKTAAAFRNARGLLAGSIGNLNARSTRVPASS